MNMNLPAEKPTGSMMAVRLRMSLHIAHFVERRLHVRDNRLFAVSTGCIRDLLLGFYVFANAPGNNFCN